MLPNKFHASMRKKIEGAALTQMVSPTNFIGFEISELVKSIQVDRATLKKKILQRTGGHLHPH